MFIRIKNIKKNGKVYSYAYIVENKWRKRVKVGARQKVRGYLGKVYRLEKKADHDFLDYYKIQDIKSYIKNNNKNKIITDLIKLALINHGFKEKEKVLTNKDITFDLINKQFIDKEATKKIVLAINDGFFCKETLHKLLKGRFLGTEKEAGYKLAKAFVEAGIKVPKEVFVGIFEKILL